MRRLARPGAARAALAALVLLVLLALGTLGSLGSLGSLGAARAHAASAPPLPTPLPTAAPTYHPTLQLSATGGAAGAALIAVADGFPPTGQVTVYWDGAYLTRGTTDDSGYVALRTAVPHDAADGPHEVRAVGPAHTTAGAAFTVATPPAPVYHPHVALSLTHARAAMGTVLTADVSGFAPNQDVTLAWDYVGGTAPGTHAADANGDTSFDIVLGVDPTAGVGTHRLYAAGTRPTLSTSASFTVDPPPPPPPACGGLGFTVPFINWAVCLDPFGTLGSWLAHGATAGADAIGAQVATDLTTQQDYTQVSELHPVFTTMQQLARDLFAVLFLAGALTWYARRLGLGPGGEALTQMVEGGLGLALTTALPWLMRLYIGAVNAASGQILSDPHHTQGAATIGLLVTRLISGDVVSVITVNPVFLGVIAGFVVAFFVLLVLIAITRTIGTMYGAAVYLAAPVCAICMVTPLTRGVAVAWARLWFSLTLWGVSYAVALVAVRAMLAVFAHTGGLQSLAAALAGALVLYGAPRLGDAVLGGGASRALGIGHVPMLGTAARMGLAAATGGAGGAAVAAGDGVKIGGGSTPSMPSVTEMPTASITEIASIAPPINAEWGLIE
jgi:hypothetical protein